MALIVRPLTEKNWADIEALFSAKGCSVPRWCWCVHYRFARAAMPKDRKAALKKIAKGDPPPGLIAYRGSEPVGWISLGPRENFAKLATSPVMKPVDTTPVWSVICFVVPSAASRSGDRQRASRRRDRLCPKAKGQDTGSLPDRQGRAFVADVHVVRR